MIAHTIFQIFSEVDWSEQNGPISFVFQHLDEN